MVSMVKNKCRSAFTIVELIVVIAVIGILAGIVLVSYGAWRESTTTSSLKSDLNGVASGMESARTFDNTYPSSVPSTITGSNGATLTGGAIGDGTNYCVSASNNDTLLFITNLKVIEPGVCPTLYLDSSEKASYSGSGRDWKDLSGNGNDGVFLDGLNSTTGGPTFLGSEAGGSILFDGVNDKVSAGQVNFGANTTWSACAKMVASANSINMFMGRYLPYFGYQNGTGLIFSNNIGGAQKTISIGSVITAGNWYCPTFTTSFDGTNTTMRIYLNGVLKTSGVFPGQQINYSNKFAVGDGYGDTAAWYPFNGYVSDVAIYPQTLSDAQIQKLFGQLRGQYGI